MYRECFQPPWDTEIGKAFIIHYTYGCDYDMKVITTSYDYDNTKLHVINKMMGRTCISGKDDLWKNWRVEIR